MNKFLAFSLFLFIGSTLLFGQNKMYERFEQEVNYYLKLNKYEIAKVGYEGLARKEKIDPGLTVQYLEQALIAGDIDYFKKLTKKTIKKYGWHYNLNDTLGNTPFALALKRYQLCTWYNKTQSKYYAKWAKKHSDAIEFQNTLEILANGNPIRAQIREKQKNVDSLKPYMVLHNNIAVLDRANLDRLTALCAKYGYPSNFEHGAESYFIMEQILKKNYQSLENFRYTWQSLLPHIEKAYFAGKIPFHIFEKYDEYSMEMFGKQLYGTIKGAPVFDEDNLVARQEKYHLKVKR